MRKKSGYNWVKHLKAISSSMNTVPKRVTADYSPYEIFFNRPKIGEIDDMIKKVIKSLEDVATKMVKYNKKNSKCSQYEIDDEVYVRYPPTGSRIPKKRYIFRGTVLKRNLQTSR